MKKHYTTVMSTLKDRRFKFIVSATKAWVVNFILFFSNDITNSTFF